MWWLLLAAETPPDPVGLAAMFGAGGVASLGGRYLYTHRPSSNGNGKSVRTLLADMERRLMARHDRTEQQVVRMGTMVARHDERIAAISERLKDQRKS